MKDHEIIAILEGCDDAQRARVMAWARKRWPAPKKAAKAASARPAPGQIDGEALRKFVEDAQRAGPVLPSDPTLWPRVPVIPERRRAMPDVDPRYPFWCGDLRSQTLTNQAHFDPSSRASLTVADHGDLYNGDPS